MGTTYKDRRAEQLDSRTCGAFRNDGIVSGLTRLCSPGLPEQLQKELRTGRPMETRSILFVGLGGLGISAFQRVMRLLRNRQEVQFLCVDVDASAEPLGSDRMHPPVRIPLYGFSATCAARLSGSDGVRAVDKGGIPPKAYDYKVLDRFPPDRGNILGRGGASLGSYGMGKSTFFPLLMAYYSRATLGMLASTCEYRGLWLAGRGWGAEEQQPEDWRTLGLGPGVCWAEKARGRSILHRDVMPDHLFVTAFWRQEPVRILDFGISEPTRPVLLSTHIRRATFRVVCVDKKTCEQFEGRSCCEPIDALPRRFPVLGLSVPTQPHRVNRRLPDVDARRKEGDKRSERTTAKFCGRFVNRVDSRGRTFFPAMLKPLSSKVRDEHQRDVDVHSGEFMQTMASLMSEAAKSPEGLRALAAAIAPPIEQEIKRREITSLLLTRHNLPAGEPANYQKRPRLKAYWISRHGDAVESGILEGEVEFPIHRIHSMPMVDISLLKHGNIGSMLDIQKAAATEVRNPTRDCASSTGYTRETIVTLISDIVNKYASRHMQFSCRDVAYPDEKTSRGMLQGRAKTSRVAGINVQRAMIRNAPESDGKYARGLVRVVCAPRKGKATEELETKLRFSFSGGKETILEDKMVRLTPSGRNLASEVGKSSLDVQEHQGCLRHTKQPTGCSARQEALLRADMGGSNVMDWT